MTVRKLLAALRLPLPVAALCLIGASACTTSAPTRAENDAEKPGADQTWNHVVRSTNAVRIGDRSVRINARSTLVQDLQTLEFALLARAAGEARAAGASHFIVAYADYDDAGVGLSKLFSVDLDLPARGWIGTYEDLLLQRDLAALDGKVSPRFGFRDITFVIRLLQEEELAGREAFSADMTFGATADAEAEEARPAQTIKLRLPGRGGGGA